MPGCLAAWSDDRRGRPLRPLCVAMASARSSSPRAGPGHGLAAAVDRSLVPRAGYRRPMSRWVETVERVIAAPPGRIFEVVADPRRHRDINGNGTVREAYDVPERLSLGATFGMNMEFGGSYQLTSTVIEFDADRRIAWQSRPPAESSRWRHMFGGRIWRYELEPVNGGTLVRESWDLTEEGLRWLVIGYRRKTRDNMTASLERLEQLVTPPTEEGSSTCPISPPASTRRCRRAAPDARSALPVKAPAGGSICDGARSAATSAVATPRCRSTPLLMRARPGIRSRAASSPARPGSGTTRPRTTPAVPSWRHQSAVRSTSRCRALRERCRRTGRTSCTDAPRPERRGYRGATSRLWIGQAYSLQRLSGPQPVRGARPRTVAPSSGG